MSVECTASQDRFVLVGTLFKSGWKIQATSDLKIPTEKTQLSISASAYRLEVPWGDVRLISGDGSAELGSESKIV